MYGNDAGKMVLELNASDDRGIDAIREQVADFASTGQLFGERRHKLVVLDECDQMTKDAQFALRRIMERHSRTTRFCLLCNHVSRVIPAIQSRCTRLRFSPLPADEAKPRVRHVAHHEGVELTEEGLDAILRVGAGDLRRSLNALQSAHMSSESGNVDSRQVHLATGTPDPGDVERCVSWLLADPYQECVRKIEGLQSERGLALVDLARELASYALRLKVPADARAQLLDALADCEYRLSYASSERIQLASLVGSFVLARQSIVDAAQ